MPLYEFTCAACGHGFEELTKPGETPACPSCGAPDPRRLYSPVSVPKQLALGLRGGKARDSNLRRTEREAAKREQFSAERKRRREGG